MAGQNHEVRVKLTQEQHDKIKAKAERASMKMSAFLKFLGLNSTLKVVSGE